MTDQDKDLAASILENIDQELDASIYIEEVAAALTEARKESSRGRRTRGRNLAVASGRRARAR